MFTLNGLAKNVVSKPRLIGVLFALSLLLLHAGNVAARATHVTITGPQADLLEFWISLFLVQMFLVLFVSPCLRVNDVAAGQADILRTTEVNPDRMLATERAAIHIEGVEDGSEAAIHVIVRLSPETANTFTQLMDFQRVEVKPSVSGASSVSEDVFDGDSISTIYPTEVDRGNLLVEFTSQQAAEKFVRDLNTELGFLRDGFLHQRSPHPNGSSNVDAYLSFTEHQVGTRFAHAGVEDFYDQLDRRNQDPSDSSSNYQQTGGPRVTQQLVGGTAAGLNHKSLLHDTVALRRFQNKSRIYGPDGI